MKILKIIVDELPLSCGLCEICYPCDLWQEKTNKELHVRDENCLLELFHPAVSRWVPFDGTKTRPTEYGKYLICRKDGKIHWETWNGSGWAYNHNEIRYWAVIVPPGC